MHAVCQYVFDNSYLYYESIYTMNFTNYLVVLYCKFPYDDVAAALLMYSTYIHCLYVYTV